MLRSTIATALRDVDTPGRRRAAAGGLLLGSLGLLGGVWLLLPTPGTATPTVLEEPAASATSTLLSAPDRLVLPLPDRDGVRTTTLLRHRRPDVEVIDAAVVNADQVSVELVGDVPGATRLIVTSTAIHDCGRYAGSIVITSRHPAARRDHLFIDLRFADCQDVTAVPAAPSSVNDTSRTWGDEGRAPWYRPPQPRPQPRPDEPTPTASEPTPAPTTTAEPTSEPTDGSSPTPQPEPEPTATAEPTAEPTSGGGDGGDGSGTDDTTSGSSTTTSDSAGGSGDTSTSTESPDG